MSTDFCWMVGSKLGLSKINACIHAALYQQVRMLLVV